MYDEVFDVHNVGAKYGPRYTGTISDYVEKWSLDFIKALSYVGGPSRHGYVVQGAVFDDSGRGVPRIGGSRSRDAGKHLLGLPSGDPWLEVVQSSGGPEPICTGGDQKRSVCKRVIGFELIFLKIGRFGS